MSSPFSKRPKILVAPLDWGLGHATRCMPVIDRLLAEGAEVILAGSGASFHLLQVRYPDLAAMPLPGYEVQYGKGNQMLLALVGQMPRLMKVIRSEHEALDHLIETLDIDACISDNRYGLWSKKIPTIFICHQLNVIPPAPWGLLRPVGYEFHKKLIHKFTRCWIPDLAEKGMAGNLSHPTSLPTNAQYVGYLSRFGSLPPISPETQEESIDMLAILSGPEPQRTFFEEKVCTQAVATGRSLLLVQGKPGSGTKKQVGRVTLVPHVETDTLARMLKAARVVISRPGYTSLMDYAVLGISKMILVPTPGQTEQEYLARQLSKQKIAISRSQDRFDLEEALASTTNTTGFEPFPRNEWLDTEVKNLISLCYAGNSRFA